MIRYFAGHPTAANILMMAIIAIGLAALPGLNKETFPKINLNQVQVQVAYPGATPRDVEEGICNRLEDATDGISFVEEQRCEARDSFGVLNLTMQESGDMQQFIDDIKAAVDGITNLPDNAEDPVITELGRTEPVVTVAVTAKDLSTPELKSLTEHYRDRLLALPKVPMVTISGFSTHQLLVKVKPEVLVQYQLGVEDIANLIRRQAIELPSGQLESDDTTYQIRFENARRTADELADLVIIHSADGGEIQLGNIATIEDAFESMEQRVEFDGKPAGLLQVNKNTSDDTLKVFDAVSQFIEQENARLPEGTHLQLTQDAATIVKDRLQLLLKNAWQGLLLATLALFLFFSGRYTFWVALGLPISFLGGLAVMTVAGVSINMISMVALLMAIGILMDDAIVLSESISHEYKKGKAPLDAAIDGTQRVARGVFSSFLTSALLFGSLLFMKGEMGQVMGVLPVVLLGVLTISLIEAFLILPHHLKHSLEHDHGKPQPRWRDRFEAGFLKLRNKVQKLSELAIRFRYLTVGLAFAMLLLSISLLVTGTLKFKAFPEIEGNQLDVRILQAQGTPLDKTEAMVASILTSLEQTKSEYQPNESEALIKSVAVRYGVNADAYESGEHLATISVDFLETEKRHSSLNDFKASWRNNTGEFADAISVLFKEPALGPAGKAIEIQLAGDDLTRLSEASQALQNWLRGYAGVNNLMDDLRLGKPQFVVELLPGALGAGVDAATVSSQLRAAYQGVKVGDIYNGAESYEINVKLDTKPRNALSDFDNFSLLSNSGEIIPLVSVAKINESREYARIARINHQRVITVLGDIDPNKANTTQVISDAEAQFLPQLREQFPNVRVALKGEVESGGETNQSILIGFALALLGVFLLLSLQFRNYREPLIVMVNIPLALIGALWGHMLMGLDFTMPSMIGFVSLAGVVVNDSILMVEFVKRHASNGMHLHDAASQAVHDRFRAIFLTSVTTAAGMMPLMLETSLQAQILVPLVTSIVFGILTSTLLLMLVLPALYAIMEDIGFVEISQDEASRSLGVAK